jgi:hypothetical protein
MKESESELLCTDCIALIVTQSTLFCQIIRVAFRYWPSAVMIFLLSCGTSAQIGPRAPHW